ncbi:ribosome recycling factor-domain-containing protein [Lipomyces oligophaga]|uniref:ribosome recycling factor-domain-containing protein n=1 Tax=Lipomyces oligophaga TaxID=45792 RepID=UPI0034CE9546
MASLFSRSLRKIFCGVSPPSARPKWNRAHVASNLRTFQSTGILLAKKNKSGKIKDKTKAVLAESDKIEEDVERLDLKQVESEYKEFIQSFSSKVRELRVGSEAQLQFLSKLKVSVDGLEQPFDALASARMVGGRDIHVSVYDPSTKDAIKKAIVGSNNGMNPQNDLKKDTVLVIPYVQPSQERRTAIAMQIRKFTEASRTGNSASTLRRIRDKALKHLAVMKNVHYSDDIVFKQTKELDALHKSMDKKLQELSAAAQRDIMVK